MILSLSIIVIEAGAIAWLMTVEPLKKNDKQ
jgi:hypothetical protein